MTKFDIKPFSEEWKNLLMSEYEEIKKQTTTDILENATEQVVNDIMLFCNKVIDVAKDALSEENTQNLMKTMLNQFQTAVETVENEIIENFNDILNPKKATTIIDTSINIDENDVHDKSTKQLSGISNDELNKICYQILADFRPTKIIWKEWDDKSFKLQLLYRVSLNRYFTDVNSRKTFNLDIPFEKLSRIDAEERLALLWYCALLPKININEDKQLSDNLKYVLEKMSKIKKEPLLISVDSLKEKLIYIITYYLKDSSAAYKIEPQYNSSGDFLPSNKFYNPAQDKLTLNMSSLHIIIDPNKPIKQILTEVEKIIQASKTNLPQSITYKQDYVNARIVESLKSLHLIPYFFYRYFKIYSPFRFTLDDFVQKLSSKNSGDLFERIRKNTTKRYRHFCSMHGIQNLRYSIKRVTDEIKQGDA